MLIIIAMLACNGPIPKEFLVSKYGNEFYENKMKYLEK
jgi:hypothetical protein